MKDYIEIIKAVQRKVGVVDDGIAGPKTWSAIANRLGVLPNAPAPGAAGSSVSPTLSPAASAADARSESNIATLIPDVQVLARHFLIALNQFLAEKEPGVVAKIISGTRTFEEQDALYAKGRTAGGDIVTNARGGYSNHNFGIAFDIGFFAGTEYLGETPRYDDAGRIGKTLGLAWGGDWKSIVDKPHFEWRPTWAALLTENALLSELRTRKTKGQAIA